MKDLPFAVALPGASPILAALSRLAALELVHCARFSLPPLRLAMGGDEVGGLLSGLGETVIQECLLPAHRVEVGGVELFSRRLFRARANNFVTCICSVLPPVSWTSFCAVARNISFLSITYHKPDLTLWQCDRNKLDTCRWPTQDSLTKEPALRRSGLCLQEQNVHAVVNISQEDKSSAIGRARSSRTSMPRRLSIGSHFARPNWGTNTCRRCHIQTC